MPPILVRRFGAQLSKVARTAYDFLYFILSIRRWRSMLHSYNKLKLTFLALIVIIVLCILDTNHNMISIDAVVFKIEFSK